MSATIHLKGRCLCGAVGFEAKAASTNLCTCHCTMCRKWGGGPFLAISCGAAVTFEGGENIAVYDSSAWAQRGFCKNCGTHLFYRLKDQEDYEMPAGLFDDIPGIVFEKQIFIDRKPHYYAFANETENLTEAEVMEPYIKQIEG